MRLTTHVALILVGFVACTSQQWKTYTDEEMSWSWRYPADWHQQSFENNLGLVTHEGALVRNLDHTFNYPHIDNGATSAWDMRGLPTNLVVVQIDQALRFQFECSGLGNIEPTDFPISLSDLELVREPADDRYGAPPRRFLGTCVPGTYGFNVNVWFGDAATTEDKEMAAEIVGSITPREPTDKPAPSFTESPAP
jgi:hypothetical protein